MEISTPRRIATPQNIILIFGTLDYVWDITPHAKYLSMYMLPSAILRQRLDASQQTETERNQNSGDVAGIITATQAGGRPRHSNTVDEGQSYRVCSQSWSPL